MAFSQTELLTVTGAGSPITAQKVFTGDAHTQLQLEIATSETDRLVNFALDISQIKSFVITSDQDVTIEFNDSTTGVPTIALKANVPYIENADSYFIKLLATDITKFYVTNASGSTANINLSVVHDGTP